MFKAVIPVLLLIIHGSPLAAQEFTVVSGGGMTITLVSDGLETVRDIWVEDFHMARTEVTVAEWRKFTTATGMDFPWEDHYCGDIADISPEKTCPIQLVRIEEAAAYCNWRSRRENLEPAYVILGERLVQDPDANGYRLPTADEWDYAARGGRLSRGYLYSGSDNPDDVAWYGQSMETGTHPVATKLPNELGLFDMSGNIREWVWPQNGIPYPVGQKEELIYVRGGSWTTEIEHMELSFARRVWVYQWSSNGFRLARNAD